MRCLPIGVALVLLSMSFAVFAEDGHGRRYRLDFQSSEDIYQKLSTMSPDERNLFLGGLDGQERADLWRAQFNEFLRTHPETNAVQRAVIDDVAQLVVELYEGPRTAELESRMKDAQIRALKAFSFPVATHLFARIAPGPAEIATELTGLPARPSPQPDAVPDCRCSVVDDWCDYQAYCKYPSFNECTPTAWGCGFLLASSCDGMCKRNLN